jgi:hypothetical protein
MKTFSISLLALAMTLNTACSTVDKIIIPTSKTLPSTEDNYTILWIGQSESYAYVDGHYQRSQSNDYFFEVSQRRYGNSWKSVKNMHRIHPDYDGKAGPREQTMFFGIDFSKEGDNLTSTITSSLGNGTGFSDLEFREQTIQLSLKDISSFAPYNTIRIHQHYKYEEGILLETVELFKLKDGIETPFVKIEERAEIFRPAHLENTPTKFE